MKKRRIVFWLLLLLFAGLVCLWLFHVPYRPNRMYRLIPAHATFVSTHIDLAAHRDDFFGNPIVMSLFRVMGLDMTEWQQEWSEPGTAYWIDKLLADRTVMAHVPALGRTGAPAWIGVSWVGAESIKLRWMLKRGRLEDMTRVDHHAGGMFWRVDGEPGDREFLSLAVVEGMVVAAWSPDRNAVQYALDAYNGTIRSIASGRGGIEQGLAPGNGFDPRCTESAMSWGWYDPGADPAGYFPLYFSFDRIDSDGMRGAVCAARPERWERIPLVGIEALGQLLGPLPFTLVGAHPDGFWALWDQFAPEAWNAAIEHTLRAVPIEGPVIVSVMGNEYGGRFFGIGVPSLLLAAYVGDEETGIRAAKETLDRLNAQYRWGLVPETGHVGDQPIYVVESTSDTAYARFRYRDRIAYTQRNGWFLAASHADALMKLMSRSERIEAVVEADEGPWRTGLMEAEDAAYGWIDLSSAATVIRTALMAWSLKLLFEDPVETEDTRRHLNEARAWVDAMAPMLRMQLWLDADGEMKTLKFELGE